MLQQFIRSVAQIPGTAATAAQPRRLLLRNLALHFRPTAVPRERDEGQDWPDSVVCLRWVSDIADQWQLSLLGDIGGFGTGSEFTWQGAAAVDFKPFEHVSFRGGYRAIYVDYKEGSRGTPGYFGFDATFHGPILGLVIHW